MTLYEIDQAIVGCLDEETGEVLDIEKLEELQIARETKLESIALWIKNLKAEVSALKEEEANLKERRQSKENRIESLTNYLAEVLSGETMETAKVKIGWRKSKSVNVIDEALIPRDYITEKVTTAPNKVAILAALKSGDKILGCELLETNNIQIK